jgi:HlyD family secretion protein
MNVAMLFRTKLPWLALIGFLFTGYTLWSRPETPQREPLASPPITTLEAPIAGIGVVEPRSELVQLVTELPGVLHDVSVTQGQRAPQGRMLASLDLRDIEAQISVAEAAVLVARASLNDAANQYATIQRISDPLIIATDERNIKRYAKERAEALLVQAEATLNLARVTKERMVLRAPFDGEVLRIHKQPGEYVAAGGDSSLITFGDTETLHVRVEFDEEFILSLKPEMQAQGSLRGDVNKRFTLTYVRTEPEIIQKRNLAVVGQRVDTRVQEMVYRIDCKKGEISVGQQMDVFVERSRS